MRRDPSDEAMYIDANGCPAERVVIGRQEVIVHYDDLPESDVTLVHGLRCTTALRTVIDVAPEVEAGELDLMVRHCLDRGLFSGGETTARRGVGCGGPCVRRHIRGR